MSAKKIDLTGQPFGRLIVIREAGRAKNGCVLWLCRCECGREVVISGDALRRENTKSCGCLRRERSQNLLREMNTTHGCASEPWYPIYKAMMQRCGHWEGASECNLRNYRDRGIEVCTEWRESPRAFGDWLLDHGWHKGFQIDRIDNNKGYSPDNCRVVTQKENTNNRRVTLRLDDGTSLALFCQSLGIETREGGSIAKKYNRIQDMWRRHKIHPELMQALREDIDTQSRSLEMIKLKMRHAELMIEGLKRVIGIKTDSLTRVPL